MMGGVSGGFKVLSWKRCLCFPLCYEPRLLLKSKMNANDYNCNLILMKAKKAERVESQKDNLVKEKRV